MRRLAQGALIVAGLALAAGLVRAQPASRQAASVAPAASEKEAEALLKKAQTAAQRMAYSGTFVYQQGSQVRSSRITHVLDGSRELEKLEVLDGRPREYIRVNDEITCYVPESKTLLLEKRVTQDVFPAIIGGKPEDLSEHYIVRRGGSARIAGFEAQALQLTPRDKLRYAYTLWLERGSGLLLRSQTLSDGEVVEQITFTQLELGRIDKNRTRPGVSDTRGWRTENAAVQPADLSAWNVRDLPPGFRKLRELRRIVSDTGLSEGQGRSSSRRELSQAVYSDGLASISVFIEPAAQSRTEGSVRQGALNIVGKRQGDFWLTIVGEVPAQAIQQVANSIEFKPR
jgi:sigma-E factor negative regulatory protein RseB